MAKDDEKIEKDEREAEEADQERLEAVAAAGVDEDEDEAKGDGNSGQAELAALPASAAPVAAHAHGAHDDGDHGHGLAHTTPLSLLFGVLGALLALTVITVAVTALDLGANGNLWVAMIIATLKAALVCVFFMHLAWDQRFHAILFIGSLLFVILFLAGTMTDRSEYQDDIDLYTADQAPAAPTP